MGYFWGIPWILSNILIYLQLVTLSIFLCNRKYPLCLVSSWCTITNESMQYNVLGTGFYLGMLMCTRQLAFSGCMVHTHT